MYIHAREEIAKDIKILDLDTGEFIDYVIEAVVNVDSKYPSWYEQRQVLSNGDLEICEHCNSFIKKRIKANIKFVYSPLNEM